MTIYSVLYGDYQKTDKLKGPNIDFMLGLLL
jgi:hypothetical protein